MLSNDNNLSRAWCPVISRSPRLDRGTDPVENTGQAAPRAGFSGRREYNKGSMVNVTMILGHNTKNVNSTAVHDACLPASRGAAGPEGMPSALLVRRSRFSEVGGVCPLWLCLQRRQAPNRLTVAPFQIAFCSKQGKKAAPNHDSP